MKKVIIVLVQIFFIVFPIIFFPLSIILLGRVPEYILYVNDKSEAEIRSLFEEEDPLLDKKIKKLTYGHVSMDEKEAIITYKDNSIETKVFGEGNSKMEDYLRNNAINSGTIVMCVCLIFLIIGLVLIVKLIIIKPIKMIYSWLTKEE